MWRVRKVSKRKRNTHTHTHTQNTQKCAQHPNNLHGQRRTNFIPYAHREITPHHRCGTLDVHDVLADCRVPSSHLVSRIKRMLYAEFAMKYICLYIYIYILSHPPATRNSKQLVVCVCECADGFGAASVAAVAAALSVGRK